MCERNPEMRRANKPAAGNAVFAPRLAIESHWRGEREFRC